MSVVHQNEEEEEEVKKMKLNMAIVPTTLATIESLTFPLVQEVVLLADFRCKTCQDRVAEILSKLNGETNSIEVSLMEKKVTLILTRRDRLQRATKMPENKIRRHAKKISLVKRIFGKIDEVGEEDKIEINPAQYDANV